MNSEQKNYSSSRVHARALIMCNFRFRLLTAVENTCFQTEAQILVEARAQVGCALRLIELMERAHLGLVVCALPDFDGAIRAQLAIARIAVLQRVERRTHPRLLRRTAARLRLTMKLSRHARVRRHVRETHAALLQTLRFDGCRVRIDSRHTSQQERVPGFVRPRIE